MAGTLMTLMWKHCTVRIRRFIHTSLEFFSTIAFLILLFTIVKYFLQPKTPQHARLAENNIHNTEPLMLYDTNFVNPTILYTPENEFTRAIMVRVGENLNLPLLENLSDMTRSGYYAVTNTTALADFTSNMSENEAIVIFQDYGTGNPRKLNYTIRMKVDYMTHIYQSLDDTIGPHQRFGDIYAPFMRLQWAIDSSYIELKSGKPLNQTVYTQEFPYARQQENLLVLLICPILKFMCPFSLVVAFVILMTRLLEERVTGVQELVKMVGVSTNLLSISHLLNAIPTGLVFSVVGSSLLTGGSNSLIQSSFFLVMIMMAIYYLTIMGVAFICSFIPTSTEHAVSISSITFILLYMPASMLKDVQMNKVVLLLTGLLPHMPIFWFWEEVAKVEQYGKTIDSSTIWKSHSVLSYSAFVCFLMMLLQCVLMTFLVCYLNVVRVGPYGVAMPWNFLCQKKKVEPEGLSEASMTTEEEPITRDPMYFEPPPNADAGISINNVSKMFGKERALYNVSFDVFKNEITVLLGHNGAGKTTLMSIITGMISATEGKVFLNGQDSNALRNKIRTEIGLCPQHNLFFPDLTISEHVRFFSLLKGSSYAESRTQSKELLEQLGIGSKADSLSSQLSGGMKRRLQLACALTGGSSILVLDEPTSGLDVETRRELWDLILKLRGDRTVLLTTHYMEEADALGDRVAALHAGQLRCHATPMHLKKNLGTGYRLSLTTIGLPNEGAITAAVQSRVPDATLKEKSLNSLSYGLPANSSDKFPGLFSMLEEKRSELGIDSIGVGVSTLEEVFLKLCSNTETTFDEDTVDAPTGVYQKLTGFKLCIRQMIVLMLRQCKYTRSKLAFFLLFQVFIPIMLIYGITSMNNAEDTKDKRKNSSTSLNLDFYTDMPEKRVLYSLDDESYVRKLRDHYPTISFEKAPDVAEAVLRTGKKDLLEYNTYLAGIEVNDTNAKILYTTTVRHAAPVALNLLSNVLAARAGLSDDIITNNHPIEASYISLAEVVMVEPKALQDIAFWAICIQAVLLLTGLNAVTLPCKERISCTRHIHRLSGCSPTVLWVATLLPHTALYTAVTVLPALLFAALLDNKQTVTYPDVLGFLFVLMVVGLMAFLALAYLLSFCLSERVTGIMLVMCVFVLGLMFGPGQAGAYMMKEEVSTFWNIILTIAYYTMPPHTLSFGLIMTTYVARLNAYCTLNKDKCPNIIVTPAYDGFDIDKCCVLNEKPNCYLCFDMFSPFKELIVLIAQLIVYMILVILCQHGFLKALFNKRPYTPSQPKYNDEMVRAERTYVEKCITLPEKQIPDAMLVDKLHKVYFRLIKGSFVAVKGVSFSVKKGECFGVLGVNGAGKSSTFKMITTEEPASQGSIFSNGHHLKWPRKQYLNSLGYCPQFFGLDDFLTGKENLQLLLTLRGLSKADVEKETTEWIRVVGLEKYTNQKVSGYSGGCQRRLGAAAALCTGAPVTLLDEPTAGVDVSARRRVWAALRTALRQGRSIIITSHSMDEMEALCARIAIMAAGEVCALGSPSALRALHATGHAVMLKLKSAHQEDETDSAAPRQSLKRKLHEKFNCSLKDEHLSMLHYHINETMRYSDIFTAMEELKAMFPDLLEDYSVSETTLEEVFLSFAQDPKKQEDAGPSAV